MPTRPFLARIRKALKHRAYRDQYVGGCHVVSRWLELHYGYKQVFGCYVMTDGWHTEHCWNILPDGRILDATAEQFHRIHGDNRLGGIYGVYIGASMKRRYAEGCECNYVWGQQLVRNARRMRTVKNSANVLLGTV